MLVSVLNQFLNRIYKIRNYFKIDTDHITTLHTKGVELM